MDWSSAGAHCGLSVPHRVLEMEHWRKRWTVAEWRAFLVAADSSTDVGALRRSTHTGRPLGSPEFVATLEQLTRRALAPQKGGRPKRSTPDYRQTSLISVA